SPSTSTTEMELDEWDIFGPSEGETEDLPPPPPIPANVWGIPPPEGLWWGPEVLNNSNEWQTGWDGEAVYDIDDDAQLPEAFSNEDRSIVAALLAIRGSWEED
ncbi:hypothetical protein FRC11_002673, partial [Ceratobasidium sp. 423]